MTTSRPPSRACSPPRRWHRNTAAWCCCGAASATSAGGTFAFPLPAFPRRRSAGHALRTLRERPSSYFWRAPDFSDAPGGDDMTTSTTTTAPYAELAAAMRGDLIMPGDPGYDQARAVYNAMIDKHPAAIARCRDTADVITCVGFAREHGSEIVVRGGGQQRRRPRGMGRRPGHRPVAAAQHHGQPAGPHRTR